MVKIRSPLERKWEFETSDGYLADVFIHVLNMFHVKPDDVYIPSFLDMSDIEFIATRAKRDQIECVFRRYLNKNYIRFGRSITELEGGDWYAIY